MTRGARDTQATICTNYVIPLLKSESLLWSLLSPQLSESLCLYPQLLSTPSWPHLAFDIPFSHKEKAQAWQACLLFLAPTQSYTLLLSSSLSLCLTLSLVSPHTPLSQYVSALEGAIVSHKDRGMQESAGWHTGVGVRVLRSLSSRRPNLRFSVSALARWLSLPSLLGEQPNVCACRGKGGEFAYTVGWQQTAQVDRVESSLRSRLHIVT